MEGRGCLRFRTTECYCVPQATTSHLHLTCIDVGGLLSREVARTSSVGRRQESTRLEDLVFDSFRDLLQHSYYRHGDNVMDHHPCYTSVVLKVTYL